jgi:hypothetical protein
MVNELTKLDINKRITITPDDLRLTIKTAKENGLGIMSLVPKYKGGKIIKYLVRFMIIK